MTCLEVRPIHNRMPVILDKKDFSKWLDPTLSTAEDLTPLLKPAPEKLLEAEPVAVVGEKPES